jgi:hypothetical protein
VKSADIKGYRDLTEDEVDLVNVIKEIEIQVGGLWKTIQNRSSADPRWLAIAKTHFQEGFSALVRSVTKPEDVF